MALKRGILRPKTTLISAATTPDAIARELADAAGHSDGRRADLEALHGALSTFTAARYGRSDQLDHTALDAALDNGAGAIRRLRIASVLPFRRGGQAAWMR
jgi:hypothetical protein